MLTRQLKKTQLASLKEGWHLDGQGLYLVVEKAPTVSCGGAGH